MRLKILLLVLGAVMCGGFFWYAQMHIPCDVPIHYRIGTIDTRFGMSKEQVEEAIHEAEMVWEEPLSTELFVYDPEGELPVNFVFDERQKNSNDAEALRENLDTKEDMTKSVGAQYDALVQQFTALKAQYETRTSAYEKNLDAYNTEVSDWNNRGGAPEDVRADLAQRAGVLKKEQDDLSAFAKRLNGITDEINRIGARGNLLIADYNTTAGQYNDQFAHANEFAQGDYTGNAINIYEFDSHEELVLVLAHELGHALSLEHVEGTSSIMYHLMGEQSLTKGISIQDRTEYVRACSARQGIVASLMHRARLLFR